MVPIAPAVCQICSGLELCWAVSAAVAAEAAVVMTVSERAAQHALPAAMSMAALELAAQSPAALALAALVPAVLVLAALALAPAAAGHARLSHPSRALSCRGSRSCRGRQTIE